jgi:hypothetical protein
MALAHAESPVVRSDAWLRGLADARAIGAVRVSEPDPDFSPNDSGLMIVGGLGLGAFAAASLAFFGAACPICVVAAPVLVGTGIAQRLIWRRRKR